MSDKQVIRHVDDYAKMRRLSYPSLAEFADAYYWAQRGRPELMEQYLAKVDHVKARVPKIAKNKQEV